MDSQDSSSGPAAPSPTQSGQSPSILENADVVVAAPSTFNNASSIHNYYQVAGHHPPSQSVSEQILRTAVRSAQELRREHPSQRYARLMEQKGRGLALWNPQPPSGLPDEYKAEGVSIGDVGIVHLGGFFDFLFNICRSSDDPINGGMVPEGFRPLQLTQGTRNFQSNETSSESGSYEAAGNILVLETTPDVGQYSFRCCTPGEGAALVLPRGASSKDLLATVQFRRYAARNAVSWYEFAHVKLEREVANGSIYLVTGHDKASTWGTSCFQHDNAEFNLRFEDLRWRSIGLASAKAGPSGDHTGTFSNQSVFLRGFTISLGESPWTKIMGSVYVRAGIPSPLHLINAQDSGSVLYEDSSWMVNLLSQILGRWSKPSSNPSDRLQGLLSGGPTADVTVKSSGDKFLQHSSAASLLNDLLLQQFPDYDVTLTHDNSWCALLEISRGTVNDQDIITMIKSSFDMSIEVGAVSIHSTFRRPATMTKRDFFRKRFTASI